MPRYAMYMLLTLLLALPGMAGCDKTVKPQPPTPMSAAISDNDLQLERLIADGLDVNARNVYGQTLLHVAAMEGSI